MYPKLIDFYKIKNTELYGIYIVIYSIHLISFNLCLCLLNNPLRLLF